MDYGMDGRDSGRRIYDADLDLVIDGTFMFNKNKNNHYLGVSYFELNELHLLIRRANSNGVLDEIAVDLCNIIDLIDRIMSEPIYKVGDVVILRRKDSHYKIVRAYKNKEHIIMYDVKNILNGNSYSIEQEDIFDIVR